METQVCRLLTLLLLLAGLNSALDRREGLYRAVGETFTMAPPYSGRIINILWKHNGNLVVEWLNSQFDFYGSFEGRTTLDRDTARLEIRRLSEADSGVYTVEINHVAQDKKYELKVIKKVPRPQIRSRPLTCGSNSQSCDLICDGETTGAEPVTYSWKKGDEGWIMGNKTMTIKSDEETRRVETFSCQVENPVSVEHSEPYKNPLYETPDDTSVWPVVLGVLVAIVLIGTVIVIVFWFLKRKTIRGCTDSGPKSGASTSDNRDPAEEKLNADPKEDKTSGV